MHTNGIIIIWSHTHTITIMFDYAMLAISNNHTHSYSIESNIISNCFRLKPTLKTLSFTLRMNLVRDDSICICVVDVFVLGYISLYKISCNQMLLSCVLSVIHFIHSTDCEIQSQSIESKKRKRKKQQRMN